MVLSSGQGSTFAIMPGKISTAGQVSSLPFTVNSTMFTPTKSGKIEIGIDVTPVSATTSTSSSSNTPAAASVSPEIISVKSSTGKTIHIAHTTYYAKIAKANHLGKEPTSAILMTLKVPAGSSTNYTVEVKGLHGTTGQYLVGYYLAGDANGTGTVTMPDITTIKPEPFPALLLVLPLLREPERLREGAAKDFPPAGPGGPPWLLFAAPARDPPEGRWPPEVWAICVLPCTAALPADGAGLRPSGRNGRPDACVTGAEAPADGKLLPAYAALSRQIPPGWTALGKLSLPAVQLESPRN